MEEAKILIKAQKGDRKSQIAFYKKYYKAVFNSAYRILNHKENAEDITHDIFFQLYQKKVSPHKDGNMEAWLRKMSINKSIDFYRRYSKTNLLETYEDSINEENDMVISMDIKPKQVYNAIQSLPKRYQMIVNLNLIEGYDHQEISEILGISTSASRSHLCRAKNKLKDILK